MSNAASSLSNPDSGCVIRTVSVSELLAFRKEDGKAIDEQTPIVLKHSSSLTSSSSIQNSSEGGKTLTAFPDIPPSEDCSGMSLLVDGRECSAAAPTYSICATSGVHAHSTVLMPCASISSAAQFVFSAGVSDAGPLMPGSHRNASSGRIISGSRSASQSNISTGILFSGKSRPGGQPNVPSEMLRVACPADTLKNNSFSGSPNCTVQVHGVRDNVYFVAPRPAPPSCSSTAPTFVRSSNTSSQSKVSSEMQPVNLTMPMKQADIPFEEMLSAKTARGVAGGSSDYNRRRHAFAEIRQSIFTDFSQELDQLDFDGGVDLFRKLRSQSLDKDREVAPEPSPFVPITEVECALEKLDIGKDNLPLKMRNLAITIDGKNTFGFGALSTKSCGDTNPSSANVFFESASGRRVRIPEVTEKQPSEIPPTTNFSSLKFSADMRIKPRVIMVKLGKFNHCPFRSSHRLRGKKIASTACSERSEAATPSPTRVPVSMDVHSSLPDCTESQIPEYDDGDSGELIGEAFGGDSITSVTEVEGSNQNIRAGESDLKFGTGFSGEIETSSSVSLSNVLEEDSLLVGNLFTEVVSSSAVSCQGWKETLAAHSQYVDRAEQDNYFVEQCDPIIEVNDREELMFVNSETSIAGGNGDDTDNSRGPQSSNSTGDCQAGFESVGTERPFIFTACPTGMSLSSLRPRTRKAHKSIWRVPQGGKALAPVLPSDGCKFRSLSIMNSGIWSGASLGGVVGSSCREWASAPGVCIDNGGVAAAAAAAKQVCEKWRFRGNQAYAEGDFVRAEEFYSLGAGSVSPHETSQSCIRASMLCYSNRAATRMIVGRMREALADCMHAMTLDPSFVRVHVRAAACHLALGEVELAATAFKECLRKVQGARKVDLKVLADASEGLEKSLQVAECRTQVSKLLRSKSSRDSVSALRLLDETLIASPQCEWLLELKVYTLVSLLRFTEAVQLCKQSFALAERNSPILGRNWCKRSSLGWRRRMTVKANFHLGNLEEALEQLQQLQEGHSFMFSFLQSAVPAEMSLPSIELIRDLLRHKMEGKKAFQAGKFTDALEHYTAALAQSSDSRPFCAVCLCNRAAASQALGHIADAIADCSLAIALDPEYTTAMSRRASLHDEVRDYRQSCCDLEKLIAMHERLHPQLQGVGSPWVDQLDRSAGPSNSSEEELKQVKGRLVKAKVEMKKGVPLDYYSILGIVVGCSACEIRKAYRRAALRHHPDKAGHFFMRSGESGHESVKDGIDKTVHKDGERLIDEIRKDSELLFKLIGEAYAVLSDPAKRSQYDSEEDGRKFRMRSSDLSNTACSDRKHSRTSDGANVQGKGVWSTSSSACEPGSRSRARRHRDLWEGVNYQNQRWHSGPDAAHPDVYARRGRHND